METFLSDGLIPSAILPTRITQDSSTLIDNIYISKQIDYINKILIDDLSDHFPILLILNKLDEKANNKTEKK